MAKLFNGVLVASALLTLVGCAELPLAALDVAGVAAADGAAVVALDGAAVVALEPKAHGQAGAQVAVAAPLGSGTDALGMTQSPVLAAKAPEAAATAPVGASQVGSKEAASSLSGDARPSQAAEVGGNMLLKFNLQSLPAGTSRVDVVIKSAKLTTDIKQSITSTQFKNGLAVMQVKDMPIGGVNVTASIFDSKGLAIGSGTSDSQVLANQMTNVKIVIMVKTETGNLAVEVDSQVVNPSPTIII